MRYLVTGGTGFIGSALVRRLVLAGHVVRVLDDNSRGNVDRLGDVRPNVQVRIGDVRDLGTVMRAADGAERVIHLACVNGTRHFYENPRLVLDVGIRGTLNVIDACENSDAELILASSSEAYQKPDIVPTPETVPLIVPDPLNPRYSYGGGKIAAELLALHSKVKRVVIFRPHNVYGMNMGDDHVVPEVTTRLATLARAQPEGVIDMPILGSGEQTRSFIHIDDFTRALELVIDKGEHRNIYHIGNPQKVSIAYLTRSIADVLGREVKLIPSEAPAGETPVRCPDISKIRALGFEPAIGLDFGLIETVRWYAGRSQQESDQRPDALQDARVR